VKITSASITALLALGLSVLSAAPNSATQDQNSQQNVRQHSQQDNQSLPVDDVAVTKVTGTIEKLNLDKRLMTLKLDNGKKKTLKVDKSVKDLDQFRVGDRVQMSYTEEIVMMAQPSAEDTEQLGKFGAVDVRWENDKPALVKVDTSVISGKIVAIDSKKRRLTFEDPDGKKKTLKLSRRIKDMDKFKPGDSINMAITDEMVVAVVA
jgi:hypothetical protein